MKSPYSTGLATMPAAAIALLLHLNWAGYGILWIVFTVILERYGNKD